MDSQTNEMLFILRGERINWIIKVKIIIASP